MKKQERRQKQNDIKCFPNKKTLSRRLSKLPYVYKQTEYISEQ